jgi:O-antigen ligase
VVGAGVPAVALVLTESRGAWLAGLVGLGVLAVWRHRSARALAAIAVVAIAVGLVALPRVSFGDRPAYWRVALDGASEHAVLGSGAGSFDDVWLQHRPIPAYVRDAHSIYLETAAELGVVGLVLLLCALGTPLVAAARARDRRLVAPATAAYAVFLVHAGLDWDWEMPVTVFAGLACGAAVLACSRGLNGS